MFHLVSVNDFDPSVRHLSQRRLHPGLRNSSRRVVDDVNVVAQRDAIHRGIKDAVVKC
jgi:hypothetical protein